jgi:hypothetical protein
MSTRKVREILRRRRMNFDRQVEESRKKKALDGLTKAELIEYAEKKGIKVDKTAKKAEILETINKE